MLTYTNVLAKSAPSLEGVSDPRPGEKPAPSRPRAAERRGSGSNSCGWLRNRGTNRVAQPGPTGATTALTSERPPSGGTSGGKGTLKVLESALEVSLRSGATHVRFAALVHPRPATRRL